MNIEPNRQENDDAANGSGRVCGDCKLCCKVFEVAALNKSSGVWCEHCPARGCSIHADRPRECRDYGCLWLCGSIPEPCRPDKIHVTFDLKDMGDFQIITAGESHRGAVGDARVRRLIEDINRSGYGVMEMYDGVCRRVFPPTRNSAEETRAYYAEFFAAHGVTDPNAIAPSLTGDLSAGPLACLG